MVRDTIVNIALYVPLGAAAHLAFSPKSPFRNIGPVLLGFSLSLAVEIAQFFTPSRYPNILDVICNAAGSAVGVIVAGSLREILPAFRSPATQRFDRAAAGLLCCWLAYLVFPAFPTLSRTSLMLKLSEFAAAPLFRLVPFVSAAAGWFVAGRLLRSAGFRYPEMLLAVSVMIVPAQFLIAMRRPTLSELAGAAIGCGAFVLIGEQRRHWTAVCIVFAALVLRGLYPFHWQSYPNPVTLTVFGGVLGADWQAGLLILVEKIYFYGISYWALSRAGVPFHAIVIVLGLVIGCLEIAQIYLPGRTVETTDPILAILLAFAFKSLEPKGSPKLSRKP